MEDLIISPKSSKLHLIQALDYFGQAELANRRLAEFRALEAARKAKGRTGRAKSVEPMSAFAKLRSAGDKILAVNRLQRPMAEIGYGKADLGKANDLKERLRRKSISQ